MKCRATEDGGGVEHRESVVPRSLQAKRTHLQIFGRSQIHAPVSPTASTVVTFMNGAYVRLRKVGA